MKIYTRTGDAGETGLFAGGRVRKDHLRIEAYGAVDELNAALGVAAADASDDEAQRLLVRLQHDLFTLGAELATPDPEARGEQVLGPADVVRLEQAIDAAETELAPLKTFILPGGAAAAAALHLARTIARRAERRTITLAGTAGEDVSPHAIAYLNRLSDLLFVLARQANARCGRGDTPWQKRLD